MERLDAFMARANAAYYAERDPYADFTTSPEVTQVFGELLGLWAAIAWDALGKPDPVLLLECGPGRGTLMTDALRAIKSVAAPFRTALRVHLIETSPKLRQQQAARIQDATWHNALADVPPGPLILLANEFLDALPIRQFVRRGAGWAERFVDGGGFVEQPATLPGLDAAAVDEGAVMELCEPARAIVEHVTRRVVRDGGIALFLDYGPSESAPGDSLQALCRGRPASPLDEPGEADLTAHVDFAALARTARAAGAAVHGPVPQGLFLTRLGLFQRTGRLARTQPPARAAALMQAAQRLAEPDRMGRLFKAMAISHPTLPCPAGFEP